MVVVIEGGKAVVNVVEGSGGKGVVIVVEGGKAVVVVIEGSEGAEEKAVVIVVEGSRGKVNGGSVMDVVDKE